jgi:hypothetical protein
MSDSIDNIKIRVKFSGQAEETMTFSLFKKCINASSVSTYKALVTGYCKLFGNTFSRNVYIAF